jgi:hypothetical protein
MVCCRHVLLRQSWTNNVGLVSLLAGLFGRSLCLTDLLDGGLVVHLTSQLSQWGLSCSPRLADLLGGDLVFRPAS